MNINQTFELSLVLDADNFQRIFTRAYNNGNDLKEVDNKYIDTSLAAKGITIVYRDSRYKKKVRILVNTSLIVDDGSNTDKLLRKLDKRIGEYFNFKFRINDFTLSGMSAVTDIDVKNRNRVSAYMKVLKRVGKVKGFSPANYDGLDDKDSFCLSGNSNAINFLFYDPEQSIANQLRDSEKIKSVSRNTGSILRAEVKLTKPKAIRSYTDAEDTVGQITELSEKCQDVFFDTFARIIPFGDFYKKNKAAEIIWKEVKDTVMRRKMLRLLAQKRNHFILHRKL